MKSFRSGVGEQLGYYVYMLIDPRNGHTFYVGRGQGDRVFAHVVGNVREDDDGDGNDDAMPLKIRVIREIKNSGLEPVHVIHRHGMSQETAVEVEAALIDAIPGLTNIAGGHGSNERGPAHASQLNNRYAAEQMEFKPGRKLLIIKIRQDRVNRNEGDIYRTVRAAWKLNPNRAKNAHHVLAVVDGVCTGVFDVHRWRRVTDEENGHSRYEFDGHPTDPNIAKRYLGKLIPPQYRKTGMASPVLYVGC